MTFTDLQTEAETTVGEPAAVDFKGHFSSPTYSQTFVDWLITKHEADEQFFEKCKADDRARIKAETE